jgi:hypothetical protein
LIYFFLKKVSIRLESPLQRNGRLPEGGSYVSLFNDLSVKEFIFSITPTRKMRQNASKKKQNISKIPSFGIYNYGSNRLFQKASENPSPANGRLSRKP